MPRRQEALPVGSWANGLADAVACGCADAFAMVLNWPSKGEVMRNRKKKDARYDAPYELTDKEAEIRAATSYVPRKSSRNGVTIFSVAVFLLFRRLKPIGLLSIWGPRLRFAW